MELLLPDGSLGVDPPVACIRVWYDRDLADPNVQGPKYCQAEAS